jgi:hypothetical protein
MPELLPNCLTREAPTDWNASRVGIERIRLYCANCGKFESWVNRTDLSKEFAFYLCNPCAEKYGDIPNHLMVPDEVFWNNLKQETEEKQKCHLSMI